MTNTLETSAPTATPVATPTRALGIVALVLGILSIVSGFTVVLGAVAIVVAILALRQEPASRTLAIAGLVTGAVSVATITLSVTAFFTALPFLGFFGLFGGSWGW